MSDRARRAVRARRGTAGHGPAGHEPEGERASDWLRLALIVAAVVAIGFATSLSVLAIIVALVFMIFMHELGHYVTAKWAGMKVTEFFIGFGPRLWSFRKGETDYGLKPIPAGAYVRIIGMTNLEEVDPADEARTYRQQSFPRRRVGGGGRLDHALPDGHRAGLHRARRLRRGRRRAPTAGPSVRSRGSRAAPAPAADAGLQLGDRIVEVDGQHFDDYDDMRAYLRAHPGQAVQLVVERDGEQVTLEPRLASIPDTGGDVGLPRHPAHLRPDPGRPGRRAWSSRSS